MESSLVLSGTLSQQHGTTTKKENKNYYVARNAGCAHSRYNLKLSLIFLNQSINQCQEKTVGSPTGWEDEEGEKCSMD